MYRFLTLTINHKTEIQKNMIKVSKVTVREYSMIYGGSGFLAVVRMICVSQCLAPLRPLPPSPVSKLTLILSLPVCRSSRAY
jgi:hypothetical protein